MPKEISVKRSGALLLDVLVALIVFTIGIIPIIGTIIFGYSTVIDSAIISRELNRFHDDVDRTMLTHMFNYDVDPSTYHQLGVHSGDVEITGVGGNPISARVMLVSDDLKAGSRRNIPVRVYMIQR